MPSDTVPLFTCSLLFTIIYLFIYSLDHLQEADLKALLNAFPWIYWPFGGDL